MAEADGRETGGQPAGSGTGNPRDPEALTKAAQ